MASEDEQEEFYGAAEFLSRWWRGMSKYRRTLVVLFIVAMVGFVALTILFPRSYFELGIVLVVVVRLIAWPLTRAERNRESDEIVRDAEGEAPDQNSV